MSDHTPRDPLLGARLGSCEIERLLGAGGMSAVYLARQERPRRYVALKALRPQLGPGQEQWPLFLARFRREADAMAALDHANITPIYEFGERDDIAYLVMPYLPDGSLADLLQREGPMTVERVVAVVEQVAAALDYAHRHGIIHRDVKPSNVLLHPDGRLLLTDFGIARPLDRRDIPGSGEASASARGDLTMAGAAIGTPDFMAPEQVLGRQVSPATDIYALGALAYTLLAGRTPFGGGGAQQTLVRQLREPPQPLRLDRPDIPSKIEETIFWALAKDPGDRPPSAGALAQAMRSALRTGPLAAGAALWRRVATPGASLSAYNDRDANANATPVVNQAAYTPTRMEPSGPNAATVYDARYSGTGATGGAVWPAPRTTGRSGPRGVSFSPALIAGIGAALVVLLAMAVALGGVLGGGDPLGRLLGAGAGPRATQTGVVTPTLTPSPTITPSPTPPANWLSPSPTTITLGCNGSHRTQTVQLTNLGPEKLDWEEHTSAGGFTFTTISVQPTSDSLDPGETKTISVTAKNAFIPSSGQLNFEPIGEHANQAGNTAVVNYTVDCGGG